VLPYVRLNSRAQVTSETFHPNALFDLGDGEVVSVRQFSMEKCSRDPHFISDRDSAFSIDFQRASTPWRNY
jgi:hypothetical protein